jgi:hypothetical protein
MVLGNFTHICAEQSEPLGARNTQTQGARGTVARFHIAKPRHASTYIMTHTIQAGTYVWQLVHHSACPLHVYVECVTCAVICHMCRVGQNCIYTPYMTVCLVISLSKIPYIHRIYVWLWPTLHVCSNWCGSLPMAFCVTECAFAWGYLAAPEHTQAHTHTHTHTHTNTQWASVASASLCVLIDACMVHIEGGPDHIFVRIYGVHTVFLAGKSPYIRSYKVRINGSGQPYARYVRVIFLCACPYTEIGMLVPHAYLCVIVWWYDIVCMSLRTSV